MKKIVYLAIILNLVFGIVSPTIVFGAVAVRYPNGTLIRAEGDYKVFAIHNYKKRWLINEAIFNFYRSGRKVKILSKKIVDSIPYNRLIRVRGDAKVYIINEFGYKRHLLSLDLFKPYGLSPADIADISKAEFNNYPDCNILKQVGDPRVYYIEGTIKRWIKDIDVFNENNFKWEALQVGNAQDMGCYQTGPEIAGKIGEPENKLSETPKASVLSISSIVPQRLTNDKSVNVTIAGANFKAGATIKIGINYFAADVNVLSQETISATIPAGIAPGIYDLIIVNSDGSVAVLKNGLSVFLPVPSPTSIPIPVVTPTTSSAPIPAQSPTPTPTPLPTATPCPSISPAPSPAPVSSSSPTPSPTPITSPTPSPSPAPTLNSPYLFLNSMPPNYSISEAEKQKFAQKVLALFSGNEASKALNLAERLRVYYPEGYYVIVKHTNSPSANDFQIWFKNDDIISADVSIHEMTHLEDISCANDFITDSNNQATILELIRNNKTPACYFIEDKEVLFFSDKFKDFAGKDLVKYVGDLTEVDKIYLQTANQDVYTALDEVNAYIKSARVTRAYNYHDEDKVAYSAPLVLSRQLYLLSLHFKNAKENYPGVWNLFVKNKDFAFVLNKIVKMAEAEIRFSEEEKVLVTESVPDFAKTINENMELFNRNKPILDELFSSSGIADLASQDLSYQELKNKGMSFSLTKKP